MAIKPILFNTEMVRAILDGRKICTRRVVKPQWKECPHCKYVHNEYIYDKLAGNVYCARCGFPMIPEKRAPYQVGDILYVRETFVGYYLPHGEFTYRYKATSPNGNKRPTSAEYDCEQEKRPWRSSIHMPKEAARIWLKVTDVRVERLQEITDDDAIAEGANWRNGKNVGFEEKMRRTAIERFSEIWDSTIKKSDLDRYGWQANPYVFVIEFVKIDKPEVV